MLKTAAIIFGIFFIVAGIGGFVPGLAPGGMLFGIFMVGPVHNVIHLASGAVALFCAFAGAGASRKYFQTVEQQLDSLRLQKKDAKSMGQIALWIDNIARRIDRLSTLNVDPELADYGARIASELRDAVASLQGVGIQSGARQAQIYGGDSYYYGDYDVQGARRAVGAEEKAAGATSSLDLSRVIANQRAAMRRKMTDRYKVDF
jgi:hypothetical protein